MAQYYVAPITRIPERDVFLARVPASTTLHAGALVDLSTLDTSIGDNYQVYVGSAPTSGSKLIGIVINDGWEKLGDGRRPAGQPDYTKYEFTTGDIICVVALEPFMRFEISEDAINWTATLTAGTLLKLDSGNYYLVDDDSDGILRVDATKTLRAGGQFGGSLAGGFIPTVVCTVLGAPAGGIVPSGTIEITSNDSNIDVSQYAIADVNVPVSAEIAGVTVNNDLAEDITLMTFAINSQGDVVCDSMTVATSSSADVDAVIVPDRRVEKTAIYLLLLGSISETAVAFTVSDCTFTPDLNNKAVSGAWTCYGLVQITGDAPEVTIVDGGSI